MQIEWKIDNLMWDVDNNNSIRTADYTVTASENGQSASYSDSACFKQESVATDNFIPLEQVSEDVVIGWVKKARHPSEESLLDFENGLKDELTKTNNQGLPW